MEMNNMSRLVFSKFVARNAEHVKRVDSRNVFDYNGARIAFCTTSGDDIDCRQVYEDCSHVVSFNLMTGEMRGIAVHYMNMNKSPSRITSRGIKAYSGTASFADTQSFTVKK